uniref:Uncharacterized protein n=2 Tax=Micrurus TaxID=8634 RepID=A0A2D4FZB3_MICCO
MLIYVFEDKLQIPLGGSDISFHIQYTKHKTLLKYEDATCSPTDSHWLTLLLQSSFLSLSTLCFSSFGEDSLVYSISFMKTKNLAQQVPKSLKPRLIALGLFRTDR